MKFPKFNAIKPPEKSASVLKPASRASEGVRRAVSHRAPLKEKEEKSKDKKKPKRSEKKPDPKDKKQADLAKKESRRHHHEKKTSKG